MYGTADAFIVYGWKEDDLETINDEWLREEGIELYTTGQVRTQSGPAVYGISCEVDPSTGKATICAEDKEMVEKAHAKAELSKKKAVGGLKFQVAIIGDFEWTRHSRYNPGGK